MKKAHARPSLAFGVSRGIKESFFHGKPNQKGKALLMMGGVEVSMVGDEWRSRSRQSDINNHLPCVSRAGILLNMVSPTLTETRESSLFRSQKSSLDAEELLSGELLGKQKRD
ncbi:unnamed protein product [Ilex paraguariensis]|uniref:Uncharacterized protein n=1 Tax=Ilex paraguariensis TaxID=185542 RepID=A0ABC8SGM3_9AQUA